MPAPVSVADLDLPTLDLGVFADRAEAREALRAARAQHWLARTPLGYLIVRYEDVAAILRDQRFHQLARLLNKLNNITDERWVSQQRTSILTAEGDEHHRLRRLVAPAFTPKAAERLRPVMRSVINGLIDSILPNGRLDLVAEVCDPYPIPIICELLGAPKEDWKLFSRWAGDLLRIFNNNMAEELPLIMAARDELDAYVTDLIARRRASPADDLLTDLIAAEEQGDRLSAEELLMMVEAVIVAGTDTTRNQLGCSVALMVGNFPEQWRLLAERPELATKAVEETMRYLGAIRGTGRYAASDAVYRDVLFPEGTLLFPSFVAANFDEAVWRDGEDFSIEREPPAVHLTFGSGIHYCLGASLARAELQEALPVLAARLPNLRLDGPVTWKPNTVGIWGPERVPLSFG